MKTPALLLGTSLLLFTCSSFAQKPAEKAAPDAKELKALEVSISKAKSTISKLNKEKSAVSKELQAQEQSISKVQTQVSALENQLKTEQQELRTLEAQQAQLEQDKTKQQQWLAQYVRSAWENDNQEFFKLLLTQQDGSHNARLLQYYRYFAEARNTKLASYRDVVQQIADTTALITQHNSELNTRKAELSAEQSQLEQQQAVRQTLLSKLETELSSNDTKLNTLEQQRVEVQLLMEELQKSRAAAKRADNIKQFSQQKAKLRWPVTGRLRHRFGSRRELGDLTYEGIVISADAGKDVKAIHGGQVVFADWLGSSGQLVIIDHGNGYMSLYAHNQELLVSTGATLDGGEVIARVGNTGGQKDNALYFEIRHNGKAQDPLTWLTPNK